MEVHLTPPTEARLNELAQRTNCGAGELLEENHLLAYDERFERKVKSSLDAVERGETVDNEQVGIWLDDRERI